MLNFLGGASALTLSLRGLVGMGSPAVTGSTIAVSSVAIGSVRVVPPFVATATFAVVASTLAASGVVATTGVSVGSGGRVGESSTGVASTATSGVSTTGSAFPFLPPIFACHFGFFSLFTFLVGSFSSVAAVPSHLFAIALSPGAC